MTSYFLVFPNQLYDVGIAQLKGYDKVYLVEEPVYFYDRRWRPVRPNKVKVAFLRAAMRQYYTKCLERGVRIKYVEYGDAAACLASLAGKKVTIFDPTDAGLMEKLGLEGIVADVLESPNFLLPAGDLKTIRVSRHGAFYEAMKGRLDILRGINSQDKENRLPPPAEAPSGEEDRLEETYTSGEVLEDAVEYVRKIAADHCGDDSTAGAALALYPTTAESARRAFEKFLQRRFRKFGPYEDAIMEEAPFMYHSVISSALNAGLLDPRAVVERILAVGAELSVPINSVEGLIRQIIGWREYMRYLYVTRRDEMMAANIYGSKRRFTAASEVAWREGSTGLRPLDMEIQKAVYYGYSHHIVRLMVFLSFFIMCELDPSEIYKWFMEVVAIDAYDWVMVGNIWAMGYYYNGAMTRPYLSSSAYLKRMSNYSGDGEWDTIWDALFYRFIAKKGAATAAYKRNLAGIGARQLDEYKRVADKFISGTFTGGV